MCQHCEAKKSYAELLAAKVISALKEQQAQGERIAGPSQVTQAILADVAQVADYAYSLIVQAVIDMGAMESEPLPTEDSVAGDADFAVALPVKKFN